MNAIARHLGRCLVAGIVALLPVGGTLFTVVYLEYSLYSLWPANLRDYYFPGLGLISVVVALYLIGLVVGTFVGQFVWRLVDKLFARLPILGNLYQTLKQILGYGEGPGALFERVVLVPGHDPNALEMGLVTNSFQDANDSVQLIVFVPACPNPMAGRLIVIEEENTQPVNVRVNEAMKALVALGKAGVTNLQTDFKDLGQAVTVRKKQGRSEA